LIVFETEVEQDVKDTNVNNCSNEDRNSITEDGRQVVSNI
jgi:hypothetical protein